MRPSMGLSDDGWSMTILALAMNLALEPYAARRAVSMMVMMPHDFGRAALSPREAMMPPRQCFH